MSEHYSEATESIVKWCDRCRRLTVHAVSHGRVGHCIEHHPPKWSKAQLAAQSKRQREHQNPRLFPDA